VSGGKRGSKAWDGLAQAEVKPEKKKKNAGEDVGPGGEVLSCETMIEKKRHQGTRYFIEDIKEGVPVEGGGELCDELVSHGYTNAVRVYDG